jgi:transcription elongation GreA/GreB family factor
MAVPRHVQHLVERGDFAALEDDWLAHLAEAPGDLDYFVGVARHLAGQGEEERAATLLELLDDALGDGHDARLALLQGAGHLRFPPERLHDEILATLRRRHGHLPSFSGLADKVGLARAAHDLPKTWEKVARLRELLEFEVGTFVWAEAHGAGRVVDVNFALESFKVDFERHPGLQVGFRAAPKLLTPLPPGHVLRQKLEDPEGLAALARERPPEVLRLVLEGAGRPLTAGEVRDRLAGIVGEDGWAGWWTAARRDPRVVAGRSGRQTYAWAESHGHAAEARWEAFAAAAPREQIALARRDGARASDLLPRMAATLAATADEVAGEDPALAYEIRCALERLPATAGPAAAAPADLLAGDRRRLDRLLAGIADRALRERATAEVRARRDDWRDVYRDRLAAEDDPRLLDQLAAPLAEAGDPGYARFLDGLLAQPHRAPAAFAWLAERAADDPALRGRNPLRLLQQILAAEVRPELAPYRVRLRRLAASGGTLPRLLAHLGDDQAEAARQAVERAPGLETHEREALHTALELRFPALRQDTHDDVLYATPAAIADKRAQLERITREELPRNRKAIEEARAMGDLRENFEYKSARQRHEVLSALAASLHRDLGRARPLDLALVDASEVRVGTRVRLRDADGGERTLTLLGPWESDPERDVVSYQSDLGRALLGKKPGESARAAGQAVTVVAVDRVAD